MIIDKLKKLNRCDYYIFGWVLYYLQDVLYPQGIISQVILGVCLFASVVYALKVANYEYKSPYFKGLTLLLVLFSIYCMLLMLEDGFGEYVYLQQIYISLLPVYSFYYFAKEGYLTEKRLKRWGVVFFVSCILTYYKMQSEALQRLIELGSDRTEETNNAGYYILSLFPVLVLYRNKPLLQYLGLAIIIAYLLMSMKRGAIGIGVLCTALFIWDNLKYSSNSKRFVFMLLSIAVIIVAFNFINQMMESSDFFAQRIQATKDNDSSGRDILFSFFWNHFINADSIHFLFGYGANGSTKIFYNGAHNDWLEIATNQGLLGVIIYFIYWRGFYKTWRKLVLPEAKMAIGFIVLIFFARTLFSQSYGAMNYYITCLLGFYLAIDYRQHHKAHQL